MPMTPQQFLDLSDRLLRVRERIHNDTVALQKVYPTVATDTDVRFRQLYLLENLLFSNAMSLILLAKCVMNDDWLARGSGWNTDLPELDKAILRREFEGNITISLIIGTFTSIERSFRAFLKALDPNLPTDCLRNFYRMEDCLLTQYLTQTPAGSRDLLKLLRLYRNTIHNNGVYYDERNPNDAVTYRGHTYTFQHGVELTEMRWSVFCDILDDVRQLMFDIAHDPNLGNIQQNITL